MKNYKSYPMITIGASDIASLILAGPGDTGLKLVELPFGEDGSYRAYMVDEAAEIGSHYRMVAEFGSWLRIYDDTGLAYEVAAKAIRVFRAGERGCIIQTIERRAD